MDICTVKVQAQSSPSWNVVEALRGAVTAGAALCKLLMLERLEVSVLHFPNTSQTFQGFLWA